MEPANRSLDLRCVVQRVPYVFFVPISLQAKQTPGPQCELHAPKRFLRLFLDVNVVSQCLVLAPQPGPSLTTEYTPRERGAPPAAQPPLTSTPVSKPLATPAI